MTDDRANKHRKHRRRFRHTWRWIGHLALVCTTTSCLVQLLPLMMTRR